ncbi:hypothetical protein KAJ61_02015 [Candidatus Parcubacteria bacterium]|nr:hypothetical protein [Candidatus Parcubacteria bacterium]
MLQNLFKSLGRENPVQIKEKYNIPSELKLNIRLTKKGYFVLTSPELPGLITQAHNTKELLDMFNDAVLTYFDVPKNEANIIFNNINIEGHGSISYEKELQTA